MTPFQQFIANLPHGQYATFRNWESGYCEPDDETKRAVINQCAEAITGKTIY